MSTDDFSRLQAPVQTSAVDAGKKTRVDVEKLTRVFVIFWGCFFVIEGTLFGFRCFVGGLPGYGLSERNDLSLFLVKYILFLPFILVFLFSGTLIGVLLICFNRQLAGFLKRRVGKPLNSQTVTTWKSGEIHTLLLAGFGTWCMIRNVEQFLIGCGTVLHFSVTRGVPIPLGWQFQSPAIQILFSMGIMLLIAVLVMSVFLPLIFWARPITRKINQIAKSRTPGTKRTSRDL